MTEHNLLPEIMKRKNIGVSELARLTGLSRTTITELIKGRKGNITVSKAAKLSAVLKCPLAEIFPDMLTTAEAFNSTKDGEFNE